jgi:D-alanyl-D-alanine carboxypeptidase
LLLTEVIETITKKPFYSAIREQLQFKEQQLNNTWFIKLEETPKNTLIRSHQYWNEFGFDTYDLDPSWDLYGGGGMVSTIKDMAMFFRALFEGRIIHDKKVLAMMYTDVPPDLQINYCLGIRKVNVAGLPAYNHGGGLGTDVVYIPKLKATIAVASIEASKRPLALQIRDQIAKELSQLSP